MKQGSSRPVRCLPSHKSSSTDIFLTPRLPSSCLPDFSSRPFARCPPTGYSFTGMLRYPLSAHYVKNSLNLAEIKQRSSDLPLFNLMRKERNLLVYNIGSERYLCVYGFGVITIFGLDDPKEIAKLVRHCAGGSDDSEASSVSAASDDYAVVIDPDAPEAVEFDHVRLKQLTLEKVILVCHVVSQSVAIDHLDSQLKSMVRLFDGIYSGLADRGRLVAKNKTVFKVIGMSGSVTNFILNRLSLLDKPDITWEDREAEILYNNLRRMFELDDRFNAMRFELDYLRDSSDTFMGALDARRAEALEIIIIILIVMEIIMGLQDFIRF